jgi:hypothetical protein
MFCASPVKRLAILLANLLARMTSNTHTTRVSQMQLFQHNYLYLLN